MRSYEDLKKFKINAEKERTHYIPYDTLEGALEGDKNKIAELSKNAKSLAIIDAKERIADIIVSLSQ